jgi:hypothetical protein
MQYEFLERPWGTLMAAIVDPDDPKIKAHHDWCRQHCAGAIRRHVRAGLNTGGIPNTTRT